MSLSCEICNPARNVLEDFAFGFYFATFKAEQLECSFIWEVNLGRGVKTVLCLWSNFVRHRQKDLRVLPRSRIRKTERIIKWKCRNSEKSSVALQALLFCVQISGILQINKASWHGSASDAGGIKQCLLINSSLMSTECQQEWNEGTV